MDYFEMLGAFAVGSAFGYWVAFVVISRKVKSIIKERSI